MKKYMAGLLFGDGVAHHNKRNRSYAIWIDQHKKNIDIIEKAKQEFSDEGTKFYCYKVPDNKIRVLAYSKEKFLELKEIKKNPIKFFKKLSEKQKREFIAGLFDAEGTFTDRLVIYNKNRKLLKEIKKFIENLGIVSYIYKFPKVFGLQIYRKIHVQIFIQKIKSVKLSRVIQPGKKRS